MASNFVDSDPSEVRQSLSPRPGVSSPRAIKRTSFSNKSPSGQDGSGSGSVSGSAPRCVCAPATHPNSFKCRLHRAPPTNSPHSESPISENPPVVVVSSKSAAHRAVQAQ